jgi:hypothetical protein
VVMATQRPEEDEESDDELEELLRLRERMVAAIAKSQARQEKLRVDIAVAEQHLVAGARPARHVPQCDVGDDDEQEDEEEERSE